MLEGGLYLRPALQKGIQVLCCETWSKTMAQGATGSREKEAPIIVLLNSMLLHCLLINYPNTRKLVLFSTTLSREASLCCVQH